MALIGHEEEDGGGGGRFEVGRELMNALCLLIFTESLITTNWEGQFKQAQRSSCHTSVTWF